MDHFVRSARETSRASRCLSHQFFWGNMCHCAIQKRGLIVDGKTSGVERLNMFYSFLFMVFNMFLKQRHIW